MILDDSFVFSANNLQDYMDCPRLFELKHILRQSWPAIMSQPVQIAEEKMAVGSQFHRLAHQLLEGIPTEVLTPTITNPLLQNWFSQFIRFIKPFQSEILHSEYSSISTLKDYRVVAVFDLIMRLKDGQIIIADWKTTEVKPKRAFYENRIQTLLYPLIAWDSAPVIFNADRNIQPADIAILFWFPAFPGSGLEFPFSKEIDQANRKLLGNLIIEISQKDLGTFVKTEDVKRCVYCQYRSLCDRGSVAGHSENLNEIDLDAFIESMRFDNPQDLGA